MGGVLVAAWWSRPRPRLVPAPWRAAAMWDWMDEDEDEDRPPPPPPRDLPRKPVQIIPNQELPPLNVCSWGVDCAPNLLVDSGDRSDKC